MRIEKIELIGFKSFADKTVFTLHPGITCIVGPNGCGKSNIVDAFRWVLGEQSAKSLRGEKMEEVIFNGSSTKKPKGMAEVTMVISGLNGVSAGNGQGQGDFLSVSRRLYRSGESEYMINRNTCRLKDIRDIFLDTGLDFRSYSILEQGRIGEIINSKPHERRFIIEEVAGVMKYKVRKAEALSKLESSRTNLLRITDIITEVKKQINILDRLAKKAERYKKLSAEMRTIELKIARSEYQQIKDALALILEEYRTLKEKEAVTSSEISESENRTESRRLALLNREKALELSQKDFQGMEREISELERSIAVGRNDIANLRDYEVRLVKQEEEAALRKSEITERCDELRKSLERLSEEISAHAEVLREKAERFRDVEEALAKKEERLEEGRRELFRLSEHASNLRNELGRHQTALESLAKREESSLRESEEARKVLAGVESSITSVESEIHGSNNEILFLRERQEILLGELSGSKTRLGELQQALSEAREYLASHASRLDSLREIVFDVPTRELISSGTDVRLLASVSEIIEVAAEYEKAVESALAEKADSFILDSVEDIQSAVMSIRDKETGKTAFISVVPPQYVNPPDPPHGIVGKAMDFVGVKEGYEKLVENLLGGVFIVRDLKTGFVLRAHGGNAVFVTPEGEVLEPSGAVVVGGGRGIFKRRREIRELEAMIETKKEDIEKINHETRGIQAIIAEKEEAVKTAESSLHKLEKEISLSRLTIENYTEEKERLNRKIAYLSLELEEITKEKGSLAEIIADAGQRLQVSESQRGEVESGSVLLQEEIARTKAEIEDHRSEATEIKLLAASKREKAEAMRNEIASAVESLEDLERKGSDLRAERETVLVRISGRESEILDQEGRLRTLVAEADTMRVDIARKREGIEKENEDLMAVEHGLKTLRQEAAAMRSRISELDVRRAEHTLRIENLAANTRNNYGAEIEDIALLEVSQEETSRLLELRDKINEMGPVNLGTLDEYEELRARYDFMTKQSEDLTRSIAELEEAISKINSTTRKRLREAFEVLNAKFGEVFVTLFGGGRAELVLTEENNILESGIDIVVQPPGKKLQNIHLLSGGEKALTALSIQFASFLIKPTPLCILDEADAPLDESNTERFSRMIDGLSAETQFIVVTHNRTTMGVSQHLYGITMEEAGVSKVISMQLAGV
jgi:chromosome segregation protein